MRGTQREGLLNLSGCTKGLMDTGELPITVMQIGEPTC